MTLKDNKDARKSLKEGYQGSEKIKEIKLQTLRKEFKNISM